MTPALRQVAATASIALLAPALCAQTVTFEMIPNAASANDMSPDGRFIVGLAIGGGGYRLDTVLNEMTFLPAPGLDAVAVSDDGSVVLGDIPDPEGIGSNVAAIWTEATGWQSLGHLPDAGACPSRSDGYELSADGSVAVGLSWDGCSGRGFIWTEATGMLELQNLANGNNRASVISADGTLIAGFAQGTFSRTPAIWDDTTAGMLLDPPDGDAQGEVYGMRDDGLLMLGTWLTSEPAARAVKWTLTDEGWKRDMLGNGSLFATWQGTPMDIADDGTIVGFDVLGTSRRAWIMPSGTEQYVDLHAYITSHGGSTPNNLIPQVCQAITTDGRVIIGHNGFVGAWRMTIDPACVGDLDGDGVINVVDLLELLANWGPCPPPCTGDLNGDSTVDIQDLLIILGNWGACAG